MKFVKHTFILLLLAIFCVAPVTAFALEEGAPAPDFKLKNLAGQQVSLSDFEGRLVLLKLATTWCPTCKQLSGEIDKIDAELKEQDVVFLEVFVQDSEAMVQKYLKDKAYTMTFHALLDDGQAYKDYNVYLIPRLLVIDADQKVRFDTAGRSVTAADILSMVHKYGPGEDNGNS